jgi:hypothetical protein
LPKRVEVKLHSFNNALKSLGWALLKNEHGNKKKIIDASTTVGLSFYRPQRSSGSFQNILLADYHGTFNDSSPQKISFVNLQKPV